MRPVAWYGWLSRTWYPESPEGIEEIWVSGSKRLRVRYDNGQLCTFKRKAREVKS